MKAGSRRHEALMAALTARRVHVVSNSVMGEFHKNKKKRRHTGSQTAV